MSTTIRYLPADLARAIHMEMRSRATRDRDPDDPNGAWGIERLCEQAFAVGYHEAFVRGYEDGYDAARQRQQADADAEAKTDGAVQA